MIQDDPWPAGDLLIEWDDETRTVTDHTDDPATKRPYTAEENAAADERAALRTEETNRETLIKRATEALTANRAYLAIGSPTTAQNAAQIRALTRQMNAVIRLAAHDLTGTD